MTDMNTLLRAGCWAACVLGLQVASPALAQHEHEPAHVHHHDSQAAAVRQLQLDAGRKWPTDAPLRAGMGGVRRAFDADHPSIHEGRQTDAEYAALAGRIVAQVDSIVANCRLPPEADANLHYVVADLLQGAALMRGEDATRTRHDGAALVHGALEAYGEYFDDPDWVE